VTGTKSSYAKAFFSWRTVARGLLVALLLLPYAVWLVRIPKWELPFVNEWLPPLLVATWQAAWSAVLGVGAGFALCLGFQAWASPRWRHAVELALLLPNMVPPLFLVLSLLSWVTPYRAFPYGIGAVVMANVLLNAGLVAVSLDRLVHSRLGGMSEAAWTMGASRTLFWRTVGWPVLKSDVACIFLFVFTLAFTSFSIPLVLGGERWVTLEVAIFNTIRVEGRWDKALLFALTQGLVLYLLAWLLPRPFWPARSRPRAVEFLAVRNLRILVFMPALVLLMGWISGLAHAFRTPMDLPAGLIESVSATLALGLFVGLLHLCLFMLVSYVLPSHWLKRFLNGYLAPSSAITGFALLLLPGEGDLVSFVKLGVALTLISFPLLFRWIVHSALADLEQQVSVARTLGAGWALVLFEIVWPQAAPQILRACGLAALWASGDFAVTGIIAGGLNTVPLVMEGLIGNYRIESAQLIMFPLLVLGLGLYALFEGASRYVTR
jgi:thiamine transport system permease protein